MFVDKNLAHQDARAKAFREGFFDTREGPASLFIGSCDLVQTLRASKSLTVTGSGGPWNHADGRVSQVDQLLSA